MRDWHHDLNGNPIRSCSTPVSAAENASVTTLAKTPKPNDAGIDEAMKGNLCRSGTYLRIRAAVHKTAEITPAKTANKPAAKHTMQGFSGDIRKK